MRPPAARPISAAPPAAGAQAWSGGEARVRATNGGCSGKRPGLGSKQASCSPPCVSSPVTWPSTVIPLPSGIATNCRMKPLPALMPSSHGCGGVTT